MRSGSFAPYNRLPSHFLLKFAKVNSCCKLPLLHLHPPLITVRLSLGQALLWLIGEFPLPDVRRLASSTLIELSAVEPLTISSAIRHALSQSLSKPSKPTTTSEEEITSNHRGARLAQALISATSFQDQSEEIKDKILGDLLVVSHDPELCQYQTARGYKA